MLGLIIIFLAVWIFFGLPAALFFLLAWFVLVAVLVRVEIGIRRKTGEIV